MANPFEHYKLYGNNSPCKPDCLACAYDLGWEAAERFCERKVFTKPEEVSTSPIGLDQERLAAIIRHYGEDVSNEDEVITSLSSPSRRSSPQAGRGCRCSRQTTPMGGASRNVSRARSGGSQSRTLAT